MSFHIIENLKASVLRVGRSFIVERLETSFKIYLFCGSATAIDLILKHGLLRMICWKIFDIIFWSILLEEYHHLSGVASIFFGVGGAPAT